MAEPASEPMRSSQFPPLAVMVIVATIVPLIAYGSYRAAGYLGRTDEAAAPEAAIRGVLAYQESAWNNGKLDDFMAGYIKGDSLFFISGGETHQGWEDTRARYRKTYQAEGKEMGQLAFSDLKIEVLSSDAALVRGRWEVRSTKGPVAGWFTLLFRKGPDGWKIVHDHTSK